MPQVTGLVSRLVPKLEVKTLLDIGIGDGETIASMLPHFGNPFVYGCDPDRIAELQNSQVEKAKYEESRFFGEMYDVITSFDSLACYTKPDGLAILEHMEAQAKQLVVIWTPDGYYPYPPFKSCWHADDFLNRGFCVYRAKDIHQGPPIVASGLLAWKQI